MTERRCRYCQKSFQLSKFQPRQVVCGELACQRKRRAEYHRQKIAVDPEYRDVCRDSPRKWRACHPDYWIRYRMEHPEAVDRNRQQQKLRDRKRHLRNLANNTSARDLKYSAAAVWLVGAGAEFLANNRASCKTRQELNRVDRAFPRSGERSGIKNRSSGICLAVGLDYGKILSPNKDHRASPICSLTPASL